jgi:hypothetical protein
LIDGIEVSNAVSRIARVGTVAVLFFMFACDVAGIVKIRATRPTTIFLFIVVIILNFESLVNTLFILI